jgi:acyl-CoA dehydrogenase
VNLDLPELAVSFGKAAAHAVTRTGGMALARDAESQPEARRDVATLLERLGALDVDVTENLDTAAAGAELCRVAGGCALPYPIASLLAAGNADGAEPWPVAIVDPACPRVDHGDLFARWRLVTMDGAVWEGISDGGALGTALGPFVVDMRLAPGDGPSTGTEPVDLPLTLVLGAWTILGALERALELTVDHVTTREQFGGPLARLQAVQFQIADATVAVESLRELARFTLWRWWDAPGDRRVDALALRMHALESAHSVLRTCHQLHGAMGFCDEHDLSILSRHVQPLLRLQPGLEATTEHLQAAIDGTGFDSLFPWRPQRREV